MKSLLTLLCLGLLAGGALAQTDYDYYPCEYRVGLFFSTSNDHYQFNAASTNFDYVPFEEFFMHLVIFGAQQRIPAYELKVTGIPASMLAIWEPVPNVGWINVGDEFNHIAAFGFPQPNPNQRVRLGHWRLIATTAPETHQFRILPSTPSSINGDGPAIVLGERLVRLNFSPWLGYSGCDGHLPPGQFPDYVATTHGSGIELYPSVAVHSRTLSGVKGLFR